MDVASNLKYVKVSSMNLGNKAITFGSISKEKNNPSQFLKMIQRPLLRSDELISCPKRNYIVSKT